MLFCGYLKHMCEGISRGRAHKGWPTPGVTPAERRPSMLAITAHCHARATGPGPQSASSRTLALARPRLSARSRMRPPARPHARACQARPPCRLGQCHKQRPFSCHSMVSDYRFCHTIVDVHADYTDPLKRQSLAPPNRSTLAQRQQTWLVSRRPPHVLGLLACMLCDPHWVCTTGVSSVPPSLSRASLPPSGRAPCRARITAVRRACTLLP